jgi:putative ABC transport system ATP-binding protein
MITLEHIHKVFNPGETNEVNALKDISLNIPKGDFVIIIGSNGSGKTTLLNIIAGAEISTSGSIFINNTNVTRLPDYKLSKWIARVFQNPLTGTAPDLSILDNFRLAAIRTNSKKLSIGINAGFKKHVQQRISTLGMGLENKVEQPMGALSGGQRQALTLLMSVMDNTEILLLDEPTAALDPRSADTVLKTADTLIKQYNLTAVLITHNLKDAHQYGNRLIQMAEGKILRNMDASAKNKLQINQLFEWFA